MRTQLKLLLVATMLAVTAGCGTPGAPQAPSLQLPRPSEDLLAIRKGDKVTLAWTPSRLTTEKTNVRAAKLGPARVCRGINVFPLTQCAQVVAEIPPSQISIPIAKGEVPRKLESADTLSKEIEDQHATGFATYAVEATNWHGRSAGLSNQVRVALAPTSPAPENVKFEIKADGILISWSGAQARPIPGLSYTYRVYRSPEGTANATMVGESGAEPAGAAANEVLDRNFEWQKIYLYHVTPVTIVSKNGKQIAEVEGDDSAAIKVFAQDIFPPAPPSGLQAVYSGVGQKAFIDLTWAPNTESDLAGYNVYRHEAGQSAAKINRELVKTPSFRDDNVAPGKKYFYSVAAVDLRGNESFKSEETSETVP